MSYQHTVDTPRLSDLQIKTSQGYITVHCYSCGLASVTGFTVFWPVCVWNNYYFPISSFLFAMEDDCNHINKNKTFSKGNKKLNLLIEE